MSRTKSSSTSALSTTTTRRPCAASADSTYSDPKRAKRSRCSTMIVAADGSDSRRLNLARLPFNAEPTSVTTRSTRCPFSVAHLVTLATCKSRLSA